LEKLHDLSSIQDKICPVLKEEFLNTVILFVFVGRGQMWLGLAYWNHGDTIHHCGWWHSHSQASVVISKLLIRLACLLSICNPF